MRLKILYAHPNSLGSVQKLRKKTNSAFLYIHNAIWKTESGELKIYRTHLPLPPHPPAPLHPVSQPRGNESPPVSEALAIFSRKPEHQHTGKRKENMDDCPSTAIIGDVIKSSELFSVDYSLFWNSTMVLISSTVN